MAIVSGQPTLDGTRMSTHSGF